MLKRILLLLTITLMTAATAVAAEDYREIQDNSFLIERV